MSLLTRRQELALSRPPPRPWDTEPDELLFHHQGIECSINRHPVLFYLRGYIHLPYQLTTAERTDLFHIPLHGGRTYLEGNHMGGNTIGMDCAHCNDFIPGTNNNVEVWAYKTIQFVQTDLRNGINWLFHYRKVPNG